MLEIGEKNSLAEAESAVIRKRLGVESGLLSLQAVLGFDGELLEGELLVFVDSTTGAVLIVSDPLDE